MEKCKNVKINSLETGKREIDEMKTAKLSPPKVVNNFFNCKISIFTLAKELKIGYWKGLRL